MPRALTSCRARPIIEVVPIPAPTNEMGVFDAALSAYCNAYSGLELAKLVTYGAGACSAHNSPPHHPRSFRCAGPRVRRVPSPPPTQLAFLDPGDAGPFAAILRRIAYTMLTLFRSITQRSDERRDVPWKTLLGEISLAFVRLTNEKLGPRSLLALTPG